MSDNPRSRRETADTGAHLVAAIAERDQAETAARVARDELLRDAVSARDRLLERIAASEAVEPAELADADAAVRYAEVQVTGANKRLDDAVETARQAELDDVRAALSPGGSLQERILGVEVAVERAHAALVELIEADGAYRDGLVSIGSRIAAAAPIPDDIDIDTAPGRRGRFDARGGRVRFAGRTWSPLGRDRTGLVVNVARNAVQSTIGSGDPTYAGLHRLIPMYAPLSTLDAVKSNYEREPDDSVAAAPEAST